MWKIRRGITLERLTRLFFSTTESSAAPLSFTETTNKFRSQALWIVVSPYPTMMRGAFILLCTAALSLPGVGGEPGERNRKFADIYFTAMFNFRHLDAIDHLLAEDYVHTDSDGTVTRGRENHKKAVAETLKNFPAIKARIVETIATDEKVMTVVNFTVEVEGLSIVVFREMFVWRIENGKIVEGRTTMGTQFLTSL